MTVIWYVNKIRLGISAHAGIVVIGMQGLTLILLEPYTFQIKWNVIEIDLKVCGKIKFKYFETHVWLKDNDLGFKIFKFLLTSNFELHV